MNESERDSRIDAAWRGASRDEPPHALDEAIRAAARRAVESGPQRKRDKHWWYPFAAAATVAVIAVGLLQLTPPEQVTPTMQSDAPRLGKQQASAAAIAPAPASAPPSSAAQDSSGRTSNAIAPSPPPAVTKKEMPSDDRARVAGAMRTEQKPQRQPDTADKLARPQEQESARNVPASPPADLASRSEPFPAAKPDAAARRDAAFAQDARGKLRERAAAEPAAPPPAAAPAAAAPGVAGGMLEQKRLQTESTLAKDALEAQPKSKTAPRSVEDWIKLIRQLKSEGRMEEAVKEIAAFRSAYGEQADSLLPADLRAPAPAK